MCIIYIDMANYEKITKNDYGNNVDETCQELNRSMIAKSNPSITCSC